MSPIPARIQANIEAYVAAWNEHDAAVRMQLVAKSCTGDVVMCTAGRRIRGHAELDAMMADFQRRRPHWRAVFSSAIDVQGNLFRYTGAVEGPSAAGGDAFDAGECDDDGRIRLLLTFVGAGLP